MKMQPCLFCAFDGAACGFSFSRDPGAIDAGLAMDTEWLWCHVRRGYFLLSEQKKQGKGMI
jgi:hypothetical protein